jgi:hypothetical protein
MDVIQADFVKTIRNVSGSQSRYYYTLPIKSMFGLEVGVNVIWTQISAFLQLEIYVNDIGFEIRYMSTRYNSESDIELANAFSNLMNILKSLKFSKTCGFHNGTMDPIHFKILETDDIRLEIEPCCVCSDYTKYITKCGHYYCIQCRQKNVKISKKDVCPLCRSNMT